ncbi:MAG: glycosyltransferase [Rubricoccaceae bacterium]|nr:glycosyltransferase [Rubricoccaceae bacterium]
MTRPTPRDAVPEVLLVTNVPTPYRLPLFERLSAQLRAEGLRLTVVFSAEGYARRRWEVDLSACGFDHVVLASEGRRVGRTSERTMFLFRGLAREVRARRPAALIVPGFSVATVQAWWLSVTRGVPYLIWSGSTEGRFGSPWRTWLRSRLARGAAAGVAYGSRAKAYLERLGLPPERVEIAVNTVDTSFFAEAVDAARRDAAPDDGLQTLTYIGYLSRRKGVEKVFDVVQTLAQERDDVVLDVVGDGDERAALEAYARAAGLADRVRFHGYQQREALPPFLARSRGLLFQTDFDIWGLVLNEAMAAGVPCLASVHAGATHDLVEDGVTGFAVDFADREAAAAKVRWLLDHPAEAAAMGQRARRHVAAHASLEASAAGFVRAVLGALRRPAVVPREALQRA